jgi:hypothetical protein
VPISSDSGQTCDSVKRIAVQQQSNGGLYDAAAHKHKGEEAVLSVLPTSQVQQRNVFDVVSPLFRRLVASGFLGS